MSAGTHLITAVITAAPLAITTAAAAFIAPSSQTRNFRHQGRVLGPQRPAFVVDAVQTGPVGQGVGVFVIVVVNTVVFLCHFLPFLP